MAFYFFNLMHVEFLSFIVGLFWADTFNITITVFWIFFIITALWAMATSLFETLSRNFFAIYQYTHSKAKFYNFVGFFTMHTLLFIAVLVHAVKVLQMLTREANAQFALFQKNGHVWLSGNDIYVGTDTFNTVKYREYLDPEEYSVYRDFLNTKILWEDVYGDDVQKVESRIVGTITSKEIADLKKTLIEFYKQSDLSFAIYTQQAVYPNNELDLIKPVGSFSKTEFGLFKSVPWYDYDRGLNEIFAGAEALGLGNGWGWDFLIPATSDFIGIVQLYLIIMTVLVIVSVMVTFLFKFSATDRLDQVSQLFHKFSTSIVRIPEYRIHTASPNNLEDGLTLLHDTVQNKPDWEIELQNLQNYEITPTRKTQLGLFVIRKYATLADFLFQNSNEWAKLSEHYDSLRAGRPQSVTIRNKKTSNFPAFLAPSTTRKGRGRGGVEWEMRFFLKKLKEETIFGILVFTVPKTILISLIRAINNKYLTASFVKAYHKVNNTFSDLGDLLVCSLRRIARWDYESYLRFEEKFHYGNQFYKNLSSRVAEPAVSNANLNRLAKGEDVDIRTFTVGAYSNINQNRIEPPIDDFVYLINKYLPNAVASVKKFQATTHALKKAYIDDVAIYIRQLMLRKSPRLLALGLTSGHKKFKKNLSLIVSDIDYLLNRTVPSNAGVVSNELETLTTQDLVFDKNSLNKNFWTNYLISSEKLYRKVRPVRKLVNACVEFIIVPMIDLFYISAKRLVRYNGKVDAVKGTLPLFKFLTSQSINKFWVYHSAIEFAWTIIPCLILVFVSVPSFALALALDENFKPQLWVKVIGNQWFWVYEYSTFDEYVVIDSVVQQGSDLKNNALRLLAPDTNVTIPFNKFVRFLVTSTDVIHSWAVPALGVKVDACPGRINSVSILPNRLGIFYGQCSEICGVNHAFMPIAVEIIASPNN